jgi:hypothetical protein
MISKIILKSFQINLLFEFFYVFNIGIIKINLKFYSLGIIIFLWNLI